MRYVQIKEQAYDHSLNSTLGSHSNVVKLLPDAYSSHDLLGALVEDSRVADAFSAIVWDGARLYVREGLCSLADAEQAGAELLSSLIATQSPRRGYYEDELAAPPYNASRAFRGAPRYADSPDANARLYVASGADTRSGALVSKGGGAGGRLGGGWEGDRGGYEGVNEMQRSGYVRGPTTRPPRAKRPKLDDSYCYGDQLPGDDDAWDAGAGYGGAHRLRAVDGHGIPAMRRMPAHDN